MLKKPKMNKYIAYTMDILTWLMSVLQTSQAFILLNLLYVNSFAERLFSVGTNTLI